MPKADREAALLACARGLFVANGYRGTSVAQVGRASGIAAAAVHWYFPSKDDLFAAVLEQIFTDVRSEVEALDSGPRETLTSFLTRTNQYRVLHREAYERMEESEALRTLYSNMLQWLESQLMEAVSQELPAGSDATLIADIAHVLFEGLLVSVRRHDRPISELLDLLIGALVAAVPGTRLVASNPLESG
ncbi:TetR/AcrR family transcriptional regulator [Nocardia sp. NPDC047648]|uniref:TetR/AcrR family transcriptional regulator n=1 Tax=Nocardia sp. NPDC047648 TaxID=3155625 RepID=UPI0033C28566